MATESRFQTENARTGSRTRPRLTRFRHPEDRGKMFASYDRRRELRRLKHAPHETVSSKAWKARR